MKKEVKICDYLPDPAKKKALVQANIDEDLHGVVRRLMMKRKEKWPQVITAALKAYLAENGVTAPK